MVHKIIDVNSRPVITPAMERAVARAFEEYESETSIRVPQREHLAVEWREGVCCRHEWLLAQTNLPEVLQWFQRNFEETVIGDGRVCTRCGATGLFEDGSLWAYDATSQAFGYPEKKERRVQTKGRRR